MAGIIDALGEKPVYFEKVKESIYPVVAGLVSSKELIAQFTRHKQKTSCCQNFLTPLSTHAPPQMVEKAQCQEVVETNVDLTKLPIMRYTEKDGGKYIASAVTIIKDPQLGRNMCFHRLMLKDKNHFVARIVEDRGTDTALKKAGGELDIAICIGNSTAVLLSAATTLPKGVDELGMANALEKTDLVKCKTVDLEVPADCEFVLEGRITKEKATEGPFLDLTGVVDRVRQQPIVEIKCVTHRKKPNLPNYSWRAKTSINSSWACQKNPQSTTKSTKCANAKTSTSPQADAAGSTQLCKSKSKTLMMAKKQLPPLLKGTNH